MAIAGQKVKKGKYGLFTIPTKDKWTVILNYVAEQWGAYNYDKSKDVLRFEVKPTEAEMTERLKFEVSKKGEVSMTWEKLRVAFDVK